MSPTLQKTSVIAVFALAIFAWYSTNSPTYQFPSIRNLGSYQTTSTRIQSLDTVCSGYSRSSLSTNVSRSSYLDSVNTTLGIDGVAVFKLIVNKQGSDANTLVQNNKSGLALFLVEFLVGIVLVIILFPFLMCCCCCPGTCPSSCCCRKDQYEQFSTCQIRWPIISVVVTLVGAIVLAVYVLSATTSNKEGLQKTVCAAAVTYDDALNGNFSNAGNFFIGINSIANTLNQINGNLTYINSNFSQLYDNTSTTPLNQAITQAQTTEADIIKISNNDANGSDLTLTYNTPFDASITTGSISSLFPSVLGSYKSQNGIVYPLYQVVYTLQQILSTLKSNASSINSNIATLNSSLASASSSANSFQTSANSNYKSINDNLKNASQGTVSFKLLTTIICIVVIVLSAVSILIALCLCTQKKDCCRWLLYLLCFLLFILTIIGFLIAIFFSVLLPVQTWGCNFLQDALSSQQNFQIDFQSTTTTANLNYAGACMPFGDGDILTKIGGANVTTYLGQINGVMKTITGFNVTTYTTPISTAMSSVLSVINQYALSQIIDISDSTSINKLLGLQTCSGQSNCNAACTADSWVPSNSMTSPNTYNFTCSVSNGNQGNSSTCSNGVSSTSGGCSGCMDTAQSLYYYLTPGKVLSTDLISRYGATCTFNTILNNVWTNYYKVKETALGPTVGSSSSSSGVYPRANTVNNDITSLVTKVNALTTTFTNINSSLTSIFTLIDPNYGLFSSINCKVIGEDLQTTVNLFCGPAYDNIYVLRLGMGIMSYFLAVSLCCLVCVGSRNSRRQDAESYLANPAQKPYQGAGYQSGTALVHANPSVPQPHYVHQLKLY